MECWKCRAGVRAEPAGPRRQRKHMPLRCGSATRGARSPPDKRTANLLIPGAPGHPRRAAPPIWLGTVGMCKGALRQGVPDPLESSRHPGSGAPPRGGASDGRRLLAGYRGPPLFLLFTATTCFLGFPPCPAGPHTSGRVEREQRSVRRGGPSLFFWRAAWVQRCSSVLVARLQRGRALNCCGRRMRTGARLDGEAGGKSVHRRAQLGDHRWV